MGLHRRSSLHRFVFVGALAALTVAGVVADAQARAPRKQQQTTRVVHGPGYRPNYSAIVVDDKSGEELYGINADELRHPASLTKIMTLYLLFEQLEAGHLKVDTPLPISRWASIQNPTKLGLKPGATIMVEDAIKGLVTRSANDAAVVIAEAIGGTEAEFARMMTSKANLLGMTNTTFINASGLPADMQYTTARDQATLGRAIQHRFPVYFQYFSIPSFRYGRQEIRNHNGLLGNVKGVDGIKTGYTEASGYNLVSSVRRDERQVVAVVLGGKSGGERDARMRQLIEEYTSKAAVTRTAPVAGEAGWEDPAQAEVPMPALVTAPPAPAVASTPGSPAAEPKPQAQGSKGAPGRHLRRGRGAANKSATLN